MPPTGGVVSVTVLPARSSPTAWTVSLRGPFVTTLVGTGLRRAGRLGTATAAAPPTATMPNAPPGSPIRRVLRLPPPGPPGDGGAQFHRPPGRRGQHDSARHSALLTRPAGGRRVAIRSPARAPRSTIACSRPRFRTVTGVSTNFEPLSV